MSVHVQELLSSKKVLFLQGPMGDFFSQLAKWLTAQDIECYKLNFNAGDWFYYHSCKNTFHFRGRVGQFARWIEKFVVLHQIDSMVCFGDCRKYHRIANRVALKLNIKFFAFEEGYIRPNYITFEQDGVNFFSNLISSLKSKVIPKKIVAFDQFEDVENNHYKMLRSAFFYYLMWVLGSIFYPYYKHHRGISQFQELYCWILSSIRRFRNHLYEQKIFDCFLKDNEKNYYVFALQVHNDFQIRVHSDLKKVEAYIDLVIKSFSEFAPVGTKLVLKHHPMDRGYRNYKKLIQNCAIRYGVLNRVEYFCDIHLPTLLKYSRGMVTVNSTTGIQALFHGIPVKALGRALYNLPNLTYQESLSSFWKNPGKVDRIYFSHFRHELIAYSQLNGAYYGLSPWMRQYQKKTLIVDGLVAQKPSKKKMSKV